MQPRKATLLYASCLTVMSGATIAPALPAVRARFADVAGVDWLVPFLLTTPSLFIALGAPLAGPLADRLGRKPLLLLGAALYALAGTAGLYLDTLGLLLASRALLGIAVAGVMTASTTLIGDYWEGEDRSRFLGAQAAAMGLGGILFLVAGGALAQGIGWRGPFLVYVASVGVVPAAWLALAEPTRSRPGDGGAAPVERARRPSVVLLIYALGFLGMAVFFLVPVRIPFLLEERMGTSRLAVGIAIALGTVFAAVASLLYPRLRAPLGHAGVTALLCALFGAGYGVVAIARTPVPVVAGLALSGLGTGLLLPNLNTWILAEAPASRRGTFVGGLTSAFFLGQFASPLLTGPLLSPFGITGTFGVVGAAMGALAAVFAVATVARRRAN